MLSPHLALPYFHLLLHPLCYPHLHILLSSSSPSSPFSPAAMREQGGGTLFSHVIERQKLSVKVSAPATEANDSKRRLSNGGSNYTGYGAGAKSMLGGSILPPAASTPATMQQRLKGGSGGQMALLQGQRLSEYGLSAVERLMELRARLEPLLKPKTVPQTPAPAPAPPPPEERMAPPLPRWGLGKRTRRSRCDAFKANGAAVPALRAVDEAVSPLRTHGWSDSTPAVLESDSQSIKAVAARNGTTSRGAANGCASARHGFTGGERTSGSGVTAYKGDSCSLLRHRSDSSAEVPIANHGSNGHALGGATHVSRATVTSETAATLASLQAKPRSELQSFEWPRILLGLSRKEKEDDFLILKGTKLPQRPRKRPKVVERALHFCTPGNALYDLSRGRYDVREKKSVKKRPRGLKAMESMESDSE